MSEHNHVVEKDGDINPNNVDDAISNIDTDERDRILRNFETFKNYLGRRVKMGQSIGLGEEQMAIIAEEVADYLAKNESPRNSEEMLLQELWAVGTEEERHMLAHMLLRMVQPQRKH